MRKYTLLTLTLVLMQAVGPLIVLAQGDETITLVPFENDAFGLQGVVPEGWAELALKWYERVMDDQP